MWHRLLLFANILTYAAAWNAPGYSGFSLVWQDAFSGVGGTAPDGSKWNTVVGLRVNNEVQDYTTSQANLQLSGGNTMQIVPWRDDHGRWTSARIESRFTFAPADGRLTMAEGLIRFGDNPISNKKGLWPAFWLLGDSIRHGTGWPRCGEVDIMETVNGVLQGYGTLHCDTWPGGRCGEPTGITGNIAIPDQGWYIWRVIWDRRPDNWEDETITWYRDGLPFHAVSGSQIGDQAVWATLAHSPLFFILNVAVGGNWVSLADSARMFHAQ
jgi:beta-glucanase (GH16 family)